MAIDLTDEERALLAASEDAPRRGRRTAAAKLDTPVSAPAQAPARGTYTPVQYDDDGWGDLPVQMRG